ncbi:MAG: hypothetical protein WC924_05070 [Candidatus Gracilibacteria bacterium]
MSQSLHNKKRISITILPIVDTLLSKVSRSLGESKSLIVEKALREFLERQLDKDTKALAQMKFDDLPTEDEWLAVQSDIE